MRNPHPDSLVVSNPADYYDDIQESLINFASQIEHLIKGILNSEGIKFLSVTSRVKDRESYLKKCRKDKYDDPVNQVMDLVGCRIILYKQSDLDGVLFLIEKNFKIHIDHSSDKISELGTERVGYLSIHRVCELKNDRLKLAEYKKYSGLKFEVQIRTILQHAWADINHGAVYKGDHELPSDILRRFSLLAGLLELADREFTNIDKDIDTYSKNIEKMILEGNLNIDVNDESIENYVKSLDIKVRTPKIATNIAYELRNFGITRIDQLNATYQKHKQEISEIYSHESSKRRTGIGLMRDLMILSDAEKYFEKAKHYSWTSMRLEHARILSHYIQPDKLGELLFSAEKTIGFNSEGHLKLISQKELIIEALKENSD